MRLLPPEEGVSSLVNGGGQRAVAREERGRGGREGECRELMDRWMKGSGGQQVLKEEDAAVALATQLSRGPDSANRGGKGGRRNEGREERWLTWVCTSVDVWKVYC